MTDLHSVHVDNIEPVGAVLHVLAQPQPLRREITDELVEMIHEYFRDGCCTITVRIEGLSREQLAREDGKEINGWKKRKEYRSVTRALVAAVDFETED